MKPCQRVSIEEEQKQRQHAHLVEYEDDEEEEIPQKRQAKEEDVEEYLLFSTISSSVTLGEDTWIIYSGSQRT